MNRHFVAVILGGFGTSGGAAAADEGGEVVPTSFEETAVMLSDAKEVIIVPGYGMAVAQAQGTISEIANRLRDRKIEVPFRHSSGRRPPAGHMNVLLAEPGCPMTSCSKWTRSTTTSRRPTWSW